SEIGHLQVGFMVDNPPTLEGMCSGWSIERYMRTQVQYQLDPLNETLDSSAQRDANDLLRLARNDRDQLTTDLIAQAARAGNQMAAHYLRDWVTMLAWGISQVITLVAPRRVVIGGGVSLIGDDLL